MANNNWASTAARSVKDGRQRSAALDWEAKTLLRLRGRLGRDKEKERVIIAEMMCRYAEVCVAGLRGSLSSPTPTTCL